MRCRDVRARLVALQDGEVTPSERVQLDEHLAECSRCRLEYSRLEGLPEPHLRVPPEIGRRLWEKVRATPVLALVRQAAPMAEPRTTDAWRAWLSTNAGVSRGAMLAYGAMLALVLTLAAVSWVPGADPDGPRVALDEPRATHDTSPEPHTGLPVRDIQPSEWQNASFPSAPSR